MKKFIITEEEKNRIMEMHQSATLKHYISEQHRTPVNTYDPELKKLGTCKNVKEISKDVFLNDAKNSDMSEVEKKLFDQQLPSMLSKNRFYKMTSDSSTTTIQNEFKRMLSDDSSNNKTNCFGSRLPFTEKNYQTRYFNNALYVGVK